MIKLTKTKIKAGLSSPVKILHITDAHLTYANDKDTEEHRELMRVRHLEFKDAEKGTEDTGREYLEEAIALAKSEGALLVCTGDAIDIHTNGNIEAFLDIIRDTDLMFTPGGHEHQRQCMRTMQEPYPYFETIRPILEAELSRFDLYFESRIVGGINIITADNSLDFFAKRTVDAFKRELLRGLPIIVFFHDPIWDDKLNRSEPYRPNVRITKEEYAISGEMIELIKTHPLVLATFGGHGHKTEERTINGKTHYMTDGLFNGQARMIEIY